jgi:hypothetical protein
VFGDSGYKSPVRAEGAHDHRLLPLAVCSLALCYAAGRLAGPIKHQARAVPPTSHAGRRWRPTAGRTAYPSNAPQCAERIWSRSLVPVPRALCWAAWRKDDCTGGGSDNQTDAFEDDGENDEEWSSIQGEEGLGQPDDDEDRGGDGEEDGD